MNEDDILDEIENEQYKNFISRIATDLMKMNFSDNGYCSSVERRCWE